MVERWDVVTVWKRCRLTRASHTHTRYDTKIRYSFQIIIIIVIIGIIASVVLRSLTPLLRLLVLLLLWKVISVRVSFFFQLGPIYVLVFYPRRDTQMEGWMVAMTTTNA